MEIIEFEEQTYTSPDDPLALERAALMERVHQAWLDGRLYVRFLKGDRAGSVAKFIERKGQVPKAHVNTGVSKNWANQYAIPADYLFGDCVWNGRKNRVQVGVKVGYDYHKDMEIIIGDDIETVWEKFDAKAAKEKLLSSPNVCDIDGNVLAIGDNVLYINLRYGARATLCRGKVKEFKVSVDSTRHSFTTVIEGDDGEITELSYPESMVLKR